ncbi:hypothetical protein CAPTEDRAFT_196792 [Capitella teleta]|uniref:THAP-type domain-containing protein n=1 Tax=Capitella teleta TaxID=283909 RepID=R7UXB1_CAPTE|nr:hypothetical protein CAPTEDRAFT_196792 [Capitella teleta]|eukprot:ELU10937.1 hypothetical protein CAPTEDRAFT_196792 [Capitella teleta]
MPHACTISNCYNRYNPNSDDGSGFSFHRLPKKNRALRKRWLDAIGTRKKQFNNIGRRRKGLSVCSRHFTPEDFSNLDSKSLKIEGSGKEKRPYRRLKDNAVPSIFPDEVFRIPDVRKKRKVCNRKYSKGGNFADIYLPGRLQGIEGPNQTKCLVLMQLCVCNILKKMQHPNTNCVF